MEEKIQEEAPVKPRISIYRVVSYFIIYSVVGLLLETTLALLAYGKIESRQGFLYGPVCPIYGVGATIMILSLKKFNKNNWTLFLGGALVGSVVEYLISLFGDYVLNIRWWDYSNRFFNINGRICLTYTICWGIIGVVLTKKINVFVDKIIDKIIDKIKAKINVTFLKAVVIIIMILMFIDCIVSAIAINTFLSRTVIENDIKNVQNREMYEKTYEYFYENEERKEFVNKYWNEQKIVLIYPNLKLQLDNGKQLYVQDFYKHVKPYYYKFKDNLIDIKL